MTKVIASRKCRVANKDFNYQFEANIETEVDEAHLNVLLDTGLIKESEPKKKKQEDKE